MRLTAYTDYSFRVLIYLALDRGRLVTVRDIAERYGISNNHLVKVVHHLGVLGYIRTTRGKSGGIELATDPERVNVGELIRATEETFTLVECFDSRQGRCCIQEACHLRLMLRQALDAFLVVLDQYTLADVLHCRSGLAEALGLAAEARPGSGAMKGGERRIKKRAAGMVK